MEDRFTLSVPAKARFFVTTRAEITSVYGAYHFNDWMCVAGSASADGVGFKSLADLGRQAQSVVSVVKNAFEPPERGNPDNGSSRLIGDLFATVGYGFLRTTHPLGGGSYSRLLARSSRRFA